MGLYDLPVAGLMAFAVSTDKVSSNRRDAAQAKACGDARKADATETELANTKVCEGKPSQQAPTALSQDQARVTAKLAATLEAPSGMPSKHRNSEESGRSGLGVWSEVEHRAAWYLNFGPGEVDHGGGHLSAVRPIRVTLWERKLCPHCDRSAGPATFAPPATLG